MTGYGLAEKLFRKPSPQNSKVDDVVVFYAPFDFFFAVQNWFALIKPSMLIIAETEIWPELILQSRENKTATFIINGRLTDKSVRNYSLIKPLVNEVLNSFNLIISQSETNKKRFLQLGLEESKIKVLPNLKFDTMKISELAKTEKLRHELDLNPSRDFVMIAGSTHNGEEELCLKVLNQLKALYPDKSIKLILAPRHLERLSEVEKIVLNKNFTYLKRSEKVSLQSKDVLIVDSMGELQDLYSLANIAFLGGTWAKIGGHNPLEPIGQGCLTLAGPFIYKIKDLAEDLTEKGFLVIVPSEDEILNVLKVRIENDHNSRLNTDVLKMPQSVAKMSLDLIVGALTQ
jgi:3-deoxy-D-manno-octulosonic-acid transferase